MRNNNPQPIYRIRLSKGLHAKVGLDTKHWRFYHGKGPYFYLTKSSLDEIKKRKPHIKFDYIQEHKITGINLYFPHETTLEELPPENVCNELVALAASKKERKEPHKAVYHGRKSKKVKGTFIIDIPGGTRDYRWSLVESIDVRTKAIKDKFPKLIKHIADPDVRFVISLGGGGLLLFAHAALFKLIQALEVTDHIEEIWGCSGGAIAGLSCSLGLSYEVLEKAGYDLYNKKYGIHLKPNALHLLRHFIINRFLPGFDTSLEGFIGIQNAIQEIVTRVAKRKTPQIPFYTVAFNLTLKKNQVLTSSKIPTKVYRGFISRCSPIDCVVASASIPIMYVPHVIQKGKTSYKYVDGSIFEEVPLDSIYKKWVIDKKHGLTKKRKLFILSVNLFPRLSTHMLSNKILFKIIPILGIAKNILKLVDIIRRVKIEQGMETITADHNAMVSQLNLPLFSQFNVLDPEIIPTVIEKSRMSFYKQIEKIEARLPG